MSKPLKIAIACGGTGGHLFPGLAVAEVVRARGGEVMLFVSEKEIDALALQGRTEFKIEKLPSTGMPSFFSPAIFQFIARFAEAYFACRKHYGRFKPDAVLGMGGFTSTPPVLAAKMRGVPAFVHESNAIPGKANRLTARFCNEVLLGFAECAEHFPQATTCRVTGTPVRSSLRNVAAPSPHEAAAGEKITILVMGGSQGAHGINDAVLQALPKLDPARVRFLHLTGLKEEERVQTAYHNAGFEATVAPFHHRMEELYSVADLAIARSGAASLSELAWFGIPSILIPYPHAAEDHQTRNAEIFERHKAAKLIQEKQALGGALADEILPLLADPEALRNMAKAAKSLAPGDAAEAVVDAMERRVNG